MARIMLVEAWYRGSHRAWADAVAHHSAHDVTLCTLPGVHWKWRMQGGPVALSRMVSDEVERTPIDLLVATSAVDLSALIGLCRRALADVPAILYLHENQITFPVAPGTERDLTYAVATWRSMLAADRLVFNSEHHRSEVFTALPRLLSRFPDHRETATVSTLAARSEVIGVGVDVGRFSAARPLGQRQRDGGRDRVRILWNHRWEHDKDPDRFVRALERLSRSGRRFDVIVAGSHLPEETVRADLASIADHVDHVGSATAEAYPALVTSCDVVVSTARHDFYGVAIAEAVAAGCLPVVPHDLAHVELLPDDVRADVAFHDDASLDRLLALAIDDGPRRRALSERLVTHSMDWAVQDRVRDLDALADRLIATSSRRGSAAAGSG